jgi:hybrid cluster-associated redox disulfide protein
MNMTSAPRITGKMKIEEVVKRFPETIPIFESFGLRCASCSVSAFEFIEEGARSHGIEIDVLLDELNRAAQE